MFIRIKTIHIQWFVNKIYVLYYIIVVKMGANFLIKIIDLQRFVKCYKLLFLSKNSILKGWLTIDNILSYIYMAYTWS